MTFYYFFPLAISISLLLSAVFVKIFRALLFSLGFKRLFPVLYIAVHVHEVLHYLMALIFLKWPKYEGVKVHKTAKGLSIQGGVSIKKISYKALMYNMLNGSFVLEAIYFVHELLTGFFVGFAPVIFPYLVLYFFLLSQGVSFDVFDIQNLQNLQDLQNQELKELLPWGKLLLFSPLIFFSALVASPSWADIKQTLPLFVLLFFIPIPEIFSQFLLLLSFLLFFGIILFSVLFFLRLLVVFLRR